MALDPAKFIADLTPTDPPGTDPASQSDDHIRSIKRAIKETWPGFVNAALELTPAQLGGIDARLTTLEGVSVIEPLAPAGGQFTQPTSTTPIVVTGVGFQPAVVMFFAVLSTTITNGSFSIGLADGTVEFAMRTGSSLTSGNDFNGVDATKCYGVDLLTPTVSQVASATLTSMDADGFTVTPVVVTSPLSVMWMAWA